MGERPRRGPGEEGARGRSILPVQGSRPCPGFGGCGCLSPSVPPLCPQERLAEGLTVTTEFHGTMQELLRWVAHAEELLGSPAPPSFVLDTVTAQIQEHKASAG